MSTKIKALGIFFAIALIIGVPIIVVSGSKTMTAYISGFLVSTFVDIIIDAIREG